MINMKGFTIGGLADLYDKQTPEVQTWMLDNLRLWFSKS